MGCIPRTAIKEAYRKYPNLVRTKKNYFQGCAP